MSLFAIADPHLSFGTDKPMDIFGGWSGYVDRLTANWQAKILPEDTVVIAGDISWGMTLEDAYPDLAYLHRLPGRKILLKGNHDYWWSTRKKLDEFLEEKELSTLNFLFNDSYEYEDISICGSRGWVYEGGSAPDKLVLAREAGRLVLSLDHAARSGKPPIVFLHYPPVYGDYVAEEIMDVLLRYGITRCYYGHLHSSAVKKAIQGNYMGIEFRLISGDSIQFDPVKIL